MAILKRDSSPKTTATAPTFEQDPVVVGAAAGGETGDAGEAGDGSEGTAATEKVAAKTTALAPAKATPLAAPASSSGRIVDVLAKLKDGITVEYNTLERIQVLAGGGFVLQDSNALSLGDTIDFELQSYQDSFVISPGGKGQEGKEFVRYSADGITTNDGENCREYLRHLQLDFPDASIKQRCVLVFELTGAPNAKRGVADDHLNKLFQMDLAPTSKTKFDSYRIQAGHAVSRNRKTEEDVFKIRSTVEGATATSRTGEKLNWAIAKFDFQPST